MPTAPFGHGGPVLGTGEFHLACFEITVASGVPSITSDLDNITASIVNEAGEGDSTVTLNHRYAHLRAFCNHEEATGLFSANAATVTDGLDAANTLLITVAGVNTDALADVDGITTVMVVGRAHSGEQT